MSSTSEYHGEEIFQMFTPCEQVELRRGNRTEEINNKLGIMSYRQFQFETNFTYFHAFLHTIPGCLDPYCLVQSTYRQFTVMKCFVVSSCRPLRT